jgi:transmembrane sensor
MNSAGRNDGSEFSPPPEALMREALDWVARLHSHEVEVAEANALTRWRNLSPAHEQAFAEANRRWTLLRSAALNVAGRNGVTAISPALKPSTQQIGRRAVVGGALAASAASIAYLALRPPFGLWPSLYEFAADYRTAIGRQRRLVLTDTVSVEMNTQTSLSTRPSQAEAAAIEVISGEVAVAARSSVIVFAGGGQTRTQQSVFDLRSNAGGSVSVVCVEGEVQVACGGSEVALGPGQRIVYDNNGLGRVSSVNTTSIGAWQRGLLIFEETPLAEAVEEINRYRPGRIILMNSALGTLPVDATFRLDRIDEAAFRLADVFELKTRFLPGSIVLLG